jgi:hypothetical protein
LTNGQKFIAEAQKYVGQHEGLPNRSGGPAIDACQKHYGMGYGTSIGPVPYCGCGMGWTAANIGYQSYIDICSPSVAVTYQRAKDRGWLKGRGNKGTPTGALFAIDGLHIGAVLDSGDTYFTTVEYNASDSITSRTRAWSDGWQVIIPPDLGDGRANENRTVYGFDDLEIKPKRYGGWLTENGRNGNLAAYKKGHPDNWTRQIKVMANSPYAFEAGKPGTFGKTWSFGPWATKEARDAQMAGYAKKTGHISLRAWSKQVKTVPGGEPGSGNTSIGKVD